MSNNINNLNAAINILAEGVKLAYKRGAYEMNEVPILNQALQILTQHSEQIKKQQQQITTQQIKPAQPIPLAPIEEDDEEETLII